MKSVMHAVLNGKHYRYFAEQQIFYVYAIDNEKIKCVGAKAALDRATQEYRTYGAALITAKDGTALFHGRDLGTDEITNLNNLFAIYNKYSSKGE